jgi:hypothetical protein
MNRNFLSYYLILLLPFIFIYVPGIFKVLATILIMLIYLGMKYYEKRI